MRDEVSRESREDAVLASLTTRRYLLGMVFQGVWWAGYLLFPFVLAKSLHAPGALVTLAVTMDTAGMLLALYWGHLMARRGRRRWLLRGGLGGRLILLLTPLATTPVAFVALLAVVHFFGSLVYPAVNGILQANLPADRRGRVFGQGALIQNLTTAAISLAVGALLERDAGLYRAIFPVMGTSGFVYLWILSRLPRPAGDTAVDPPAGFADIFTVPRLPLGPVRWRRLAAALATPFRQALQTYREDRAYLWYEINFMIYGTAFMMLNPVVPLYFTERLDLGYAQITNARVLIASLGVAVLGPLTGRLMDRFHPVRLCTIAFAVLVLYPAALALAGRFSVLSPAAAAYLAFGVYALGMSGVNVAWHVGSISFAPPGQGGYYQGIHVTMVGVRGVVGPLAGYAVLRLLGYLEVFVAAAIFFLLASFSSVFLWRWMKRAADASGEV
ncbi:MFS transporter [bacterium]|nr:MFS transporter [bacterium]MBU1071979.1 MFS transporter [bacterium]MBU1675389.1 MFS transporter [bacterium]